MPISTVIYLIPFEDVALRPTMGHYAHAAFLSILHQGDAEKAEEVHRTSAQKPFTVSPLIGKGERHGANLLIRSGTECWIRYTFLDDELFAYFGNAFFMQELPSIRLGGATFQLSRLVASSPPPAGGPEGNAFGPPRGRGGAEAQNWSGNATYEDLIAAAQVQKSKTHGTERIHLRFYSPTAFREQTPRGEKTWNRPGIDLVRCYQSWINKWNTFAPVPIDKQEMLAFIANHAGLIRINTRTQMLDFGNHKEIGFVGSGIYEFREDWGDDYDYDALELPPPRPTQPLNANLLRQANLLADFAFYCGTGYKTTMGMGQTRRMR